MYVHIHIHIRMYMAPDKGPTWINICLTSWLVPFFWDLGASCPTIWWYVRPGGLCAFADSCWDAWTRCWLGESIGHRYDVLLLFVEPSWHKTGILCLFPQRCEVGCSSCANSKTWGLNKSYTCWKPRRIRRLAIFRCGCLKMGMPVLPKWQLQWG